ncbi:MAG: flagellar assembly protein FliW [Bacillota bacterium]
MECASESVEKNSRQSGLTVSFPWGMPGLDYKQYRLTALAEESPFFYLQSTEQPEVGLLLINPFAVERDYEFDISEDVVKKLKIEDQKQVAVFCTVNTNLGASSPTVNLLAPIVVNVDRLLGKQIVLNDKKYSLRTPLVLSSGDQEAG